MTKVIFSGSKSFRKTYTPEERIEIYKKNQLKWQEEERKKPVSTFFKKTGAFTWDTAVSLKQAGGWTWEQIKKIKPFRVEV
jgi:hypothetical protein